MIQIVIAALFPLIALISFGYLLQKSNWLDVGFWRAAEKLNYYVLFPVMLFFESGACGYCVKVNSAGEFGCDHHYAQRDCAAVCF